MGGFAHAQVLALADKIVEAVKSGAIRKFVVMAGCDGRAKSRNYYTDFAKGLPLSLIHISQEEIPVPERQESRRRLKEGIEDT